MEQYCQTPDLGLRLRVDFVFTMGTESPTKIYQKEVSYRYGILSNFSPKSRLLSYPCHKKNNNNNNNPPKSIRKGCTRRLKFDTQTTHGLFAEFRGLGVQMTHATRRTRRTPPKSTITAVFTNSFF